MQLSFMVGARVVEAGTFREGYRKYILTCFAFRLFLGDSSHHLFSAAEITDYCNNTYRIQQCLIFSQL